MCLWLKPTIPLLASLASHHVYAPPHTLALAHMIRQRGSVSGEKNPSWDEAVQRQCRREANKLKRWLWGI